MPCLCTSDLDYVFRNEMTGGPINQGEWAREFWHRPLRALGIRPRKFYATRHTFISVALTAGVNLKWLAEQCGNSVSTIEKHYGRSLAGDAEAQLRLLAAAEARTPRERIALVEGAKSETVSPSVEARPGKLLESGVVPTGIEPVPFARLRTQKSQYWQGFSAFSGCGGTVLS